MQDKGRSRLAMNDKYKVAPRPSTRKLERETWDWDTVRTRDVLQPSMTRSLRQMSLLWGASHLGHVKHGVGKSPCPLSVSSDCLKIGSLNAEDKSPDGSNTGLATPALSVDVCWSAIPMVTLPRRWSEIHQNWKPGEIPWS